MAEKVNKDSSKGSGAGKFFLGAALGAVAGMVASKFVSAKVSKTTEDCECGGSCDCGDTDKDDKAGIECEVTLEAGAKHSDKEGEAKKSTKEKTENAPADEPANKTE